MLFAGLDAQVLGLSVDHIPCLVAWAESLGGINYPLLSDFWPHGAVAQTYGVLRSEGKSERAIFVLDKRGVIRYIDIHDIDDQPSNVELRSVLRQVDPEAAARAPKRWSPRMWNYRTAGSSCTAHPGARIANARACGWPNATWPTPR